MFIKILKRIKTLEVTAFITGFSLMTYELAAARVLAPTLGSTTYVWTSVIGVIIASLAFGFFIGGKLADKRNQLTDIIWLLGLSALTVIWTLAAYQQVLHTVATWEVDVRIHGVVAALILFAPTSFVIGLTSPYLAKLNVRSLNTTGQHIASLDALNSVGGIVGTFLTGFVLFGYVGSRQTFAVVALLLILASWLIMPLHKTKHRIAATLLAMVMLVAMQVENRNVIVIDTLTAHYEIGEFYYNGVRTRGLATGPGGIQSGVRSDGSPGLVFWYTQQVAGIALHQKPSKILVLGGGAFTLPQYLSEQLPGSTIDVVEIDPELKNISEKYFYYKNPANVRPIFADARNYINQTQNKYDMIIVDVYGDSEIPFSMTTREYAAQLNRLLNSNGSVVANIVAGVRGPCQNVLTALNASYAGIFPYQYFIGNDQYNRTRTNMVFLYSRQAKDINGMSVVNLAKQQPFSDNYAPADRLFYECQQMAQLSS